MTTVLKNARGRVIHDITGRRFGHLEVIGRVPVDNSHGSSKHTHKWLCRCVCGGSTLLEAVYLLRGRRRTCGCHTPPVPPLEVLPDDVLSSWSRDEFIEAVVKTFKEDGGPVMRVARRFRATKGVIIGILYRAGLIGQRRKLLDAPPRPKVIKVIQPHFEDDPRAIRFDYGRVGLPPATETGQYATPLIEAIHGRWQPFRLPSSNH